MISMFGSLSIKIETKHKRKTVGNETEKRSWTHGLLKKWHLSQRRRHKKSKGHSIVLFVESMQIIFKCKHMNLHLGYLLDFFWFLDAAMYPTTTPTANPPINASSFVWDIFDNCKLKCQISLWQVCCSLVSQKNYNGDFAGKDFRAIRKRRWDGYSNW